MDAKKPVPDTIPIHPGIVPLPPETADIHLAAYNQGWEAMCAGYPSTVNPYLASKKTKELAKWWETGWMGFEEDGEYDNDDDPSLW